MSTVPSGKPRRGRGYRLEHALETLIFRSRWLLAPVYLGLMFALVALVVVFLRELVHDFAQLLSMNGQQVVMMALSLVDLSLAGNLLVIVVFSGYENFISRIDVADEDERPSWMGTVDFSALKLKLFATIVAISGIALLRAFLALGEGQAITDRSLAWLVGIHFTFVVSALLMALTDRIKGRHEPK
jgi:uncharacterized protein (TIGR00645 family)